MYRLIRWILFLFYPERIHYILIKVLRGLKRFYITTPILRLIYNYKNPSLEREVFGVKFRNPVGLASGFDKNCDCYHLLSDFGFGFIEVGTLTPQPQEGMNKPRVFLLPKDEAIINKNGSANLGVRHAVYILKRNKCSSPIGANISYCEKTPQNRIIKEFELAFEYLYDFVDYFAINVSTPNSKDCGVVKSTEQLSEILDSLLTIRNMYDEYRPILLKVTPDISNSELDEIIDIALVSGLDGIITSSATFRRENLKTTQKNLSRIGDGALSGKPLFNRNLEIVKYVHAKTRGQLPIIACGGIMTPQEAKQMLDAGCSLIQIFSGFVYKGPSIVKKINKYLVKCHKEQSANQNCKAK